MATGSSALQDRAALRELRILRKSIDNLDAALISILAERFAVTERVGQLKAAHTFPAVDPAREAKQGARVRALAKKAGLEPAVAERLLRAIVSEVVQRHRAIAKVARARR